MHSSTASMILRELAKREMLTTRMTTFQVPRHPQVVHLNDVREAFIAIADAAGYGPRTLRFSYNAGIEVFCTRVLFEKIFKVVFVNEKLFPKNRSDNVGEPGAPLPILYVTSEKTQVRQIPLAETRPWPFKFLLELGGMIVCRPADKRDFALELRQFINNHPQFRMGIDVKECPDGSVAVFTWWFERLHGKWKRMNLNVPERRG